MSKNKKVLFRADSSSKIGIGHIMRDLVLASKYAKQGADITFATQDLKGNINQKILNSGYKVKILKSNSKKELVKLLKKLSLNMLVIDHYKIGHKKEKYIKANTNIKILSFDDTYEKHYCDILLNHNIGADKTRYKDLVSSACKVKCGSKYTLIRDEFIKEKKKVIFLAMGGADHSNINIDILKVLKKFKNVKVNLVTTTANKNLDKLKKYVKTKEWIFLHVETNKIANLMSESDLAIVTPSVVLNEVYFMELPFIAIKTANNQKDIYNYLQKNNFLVMKRINPLKLKKNLFKLLKKLNYYE